MAKNRSQRQREAEHKRRRVAAQPIKVKPKGTGDLMLERVQRRREVDRAILALFGARG